MTHLQIDEMKNCIGVVISQHTTNNLQHEIPLKCNKYLDAALKIIIRFIMVVK